MIDAAIATIGVTLLAAHKIVAGASTTLLGFALVIGAAIAWAVGNVIARRAAGRADVDIVGFVVWASLAAPLPLAAASWLFEVGPAVLTAIVDMRWQTWACVLFMSYFATLFGLATWNALLIPVSGLMSGAAFLGEGLAPLQLAGVAFVLAGLAWNVYSAQARAWLVRTLD